MSQQIPVRPVEDIIKEKLSAAEDRKMFKDDLMDVLDDEDVIRDLGEGQQKKTKLKALKNLLDRGEVSYSEDWKIYLEE